MHRKSPQWIKCCFGSVKALLPFWKLNAIICSTRKLVMKELIAYFRTVTLVVHTTSTSERILACLCTLMHQDMKKTRDKISEGTARNVFTWECMKNDIFSPHLKDSNNNLRKSLWRQTPQLGLRVACTQFCAFSQKAGGEEKAGSPLIPSHLHRCFIILHACSCHSSKVLY